jgi:hypothetical protein
MMMMTPICDSKKNIQLATAKVEMMVVNKELQHMSNNT